MSRKILILSPQAGFGNRMRMLCSGIVLAEALDRVPMCYWPKGDRAFGDTYFVGQTREQGWNGFFYQHPDFSSVTPNNVSKIDHSFSEWLPGEFWYPRQNTAHEAWGIQPDVRIEEDADILRNYSEDPVILIESSREMRLSDYSQSEWNGLMSKAYQKYFRPRTEYLERLFDLPKYDIGVVIRRGEFLHYFPEEAHTEEVLRDWLEGIAKKHRQRSIVLFSDDHVLRDTLRSHLQQMGVDCPDLRWEGLRPWQVSYLEFLILARHVSECIYGTPKSSFAEQAAIFSGVSFFPIQPQIETPPLHQGDLQYDKEIDEVTIAILAKDKAHILPFYLEAIENQTYPSSKIKLYIRTNNNSDSTEEILREWIEGVKDRYSEIYFDPNPADQPVHEYAPHEWNPIRFDVIGRIREESAAWARERNTHYFVADCDNLLSPKTLENMLDTKLPVVGPFLRVMESHESMYSNYHYKTDVNGYFEDHPHYGEIWTQRIKGLIEVDVIHCTYLLRNEILEYVKYVDGSGRFEYVIFSENLRSLGIPQYLDNRYVYGRLTFCDSVEDFDQYNIGNESIRQVYQSVF